jgi:hypothetical protein
MAQATPSLALLPINELPPPPSFEQELAKALEDTPAPKAARELLRQGRLPAVD